MVYLEQELLSLGWENIVKGYREVGGMANQRSKNLFCFLLSSRYETVCCEKKKKKIRKFLGADFLFLLPKGYGQPTA